MSAIRNVRTAWGVDVPVLGLGTWRLGERMLGRKAEAESLRMGLDLGLTLVDTAEMYADGGAEKVVGKAIAGRRDEVFLVGKVVPGNGTKERMTRACEKSLKRLRTDRIDLYLLHWPGNRSHAEALEAFERLREQGKILRYGVSNFDVEQMERLASLPLGREVACNQILYNLGRRGIERRLLPWCRRNKVLAMAYSPLEQGRIDQKGALAAVAKKHGVSPACVALAWTIRDDGLVTIVKASRPEHLRENVRAASLVLTGEDLAALDAAFPVPAQDVPLETL